MRTSRFSFWLLTGLALLAGAGTVGAKPTDSAGALDSKTCLTCHSDKAAALRTRDADGKSRALAGIHAERYGKGVHGELECVACHKEIADSRAPHKKTSTAKPNCVACHTSIWETITKQDLTREKARLGVVVENMSVYKNSFHAPPSTGDPSLLNATCESVPSASAGQASR